MGVNVGKGLGGAATGAATGAALGSVVPVLGTAIGAIGGGIIGGLGGLFSGGGHGDIDAAAFNDPNRAANLQMIQARQNQLQMQGTPLAAGTTINTGDSDQLRAQQMALINAQQARVAGTAPSVAQIQLQRGADHNMANIAAQAASARGGVNTGLLARNVLNAQATTGQQNASDMALLRAQEQTSAEGALAGNLNGTRGQDLSLATNQAGLTQQTALANAAAQQQQQQHANALIAQYTQMGLSLDQAQFLANQELAKTNAGIEAGAAARDQQMTGGLLSAGGSMLGMLATQKGAAAAPAISGASFGGSSYFSPSGTA